MVPTLPFAEMIIGTAAFAAPAAVVLEPKFALAAACAAMAAAKVLRAQLLRRFPLLLLAACAFMATVLMTVSAKSAMTPATLALVCAGAAYAYERLFDKRFATADASVDAERTFATAGALLTAGLALHTALLPAVATRNLMLAANQAPALLLAGAIGAAAAAAVTALILAMQRAWQPVASMQWRFMTMDAALLATYVAVPAAIVASAWVDCAVLRKAARKGITALVNATAPDGTVNAVRAVPAEHYAAIAAGLLVRWLPPLCSSSRPPLTRSPHAPRCCCSL